MSGRYRLDWFRSINTFPPDFLFLFEGQVAPFALHIRLRPRNKGELIPLLFICILFFFLLLLFFAFAILLW